MNNEILREIITTPMPYGKYKGTMISDLPLYYLEWFASKGFPKGKLGMLLATTFEIKTNGLQEIIDTLKKLEKAFIFLLFVKTSKVTSLENNYKNTTSFAVKCNNSYNLLM